MNLRTWCKCPVQARKLAGCETISACKWAPLQQRSRVPAHSRTLQQEPGWGTHPHSAFHYPQMPETETCAVISATSKHPPAHVCTVLPQNLSQLWAQKHKDCSMSLKWVQIPTVSHPVTPNPRGSERGKAALWSYEKGSEQPGQHQWLLQGKAQLNLCSYSGISEQLLRNKTCLLSFRWSLLNPLRLRESD